MFAQAAGIDILHIPYKGNGAALPDVISGRVNLICGGYISMAPFIKAGKATPPGGDIDCSSRCIARCTYLH
jgi:tripartite-type tricarboxylate transporter receptor subunit TctC